MKRILAMFLAIAMCTTMLAGCGNSGDGGKKDLSAVQSVIKEAQGMTMEELAKKAIEESNGKTFYGVGNSSRGKSALPLFIEYLQSIDPSYTLNFEWQQPKNKRTWQAWPPIPWSSLRWSRWHRAASALWLRARPR